MNKEDRVFRSDYEIVDEYKPAEFEKISLHGVMDLIIDIDKRNRRHLKILDMWADYFKSINIPYRITVDPQNERHGLVLWKERRAE